MLLYIYKSVNHYDIKLKVAGSTIQVSHLTFIIHTVDRVFMKTKETRDSPKRSSGSQEQTNTLIPINIPRSVKSKCCLQVHLLSSCL